MGVQAHYVKNIISYMGFMEDFDVSLLHYFVPTNVNIDSTGILKQSLT